jgi:hypothetical protein
MNKLADQLLQPPAIVEQQKQSKFICSACGSARDCDCAAPAMERIAEIREQKRQAQAKWREKSKENNDRVESTSADSPHEEITKSSPGTKPPTEPKPLDEDDLIVNLHNGPVTEIRHGLQKLSAAGRARLREMAFDAWNDARLKEPDEIAF